MSIFRSIFLNNPIVLAVEAMIKDPVIPFVIVIFTFFGWLVNDTHKAYIEQENAAKVERVIQEYSLVSLNGTNDLNGEFNQTFFAGHGYIGENLYYHFFYETENGIKYQKQRADFSYPNIYIKETDSTPRFLVYGEYYQFPEKSDYLDTLLIRKTRQVLEIPKGTLKTNYHINQ
jgi:hypothetical protein